MTSPDVSSADLARMRARWSALHGGYHAESSIVLRSWLDAMHRLGRPLARRGVSPAAVTCAGALVAVGSACAARRAPASAAVLVVSSVVLDGVDGAVAIATDRVSARGAFLDATADRIADACFGLSLGRVGAPRPLSLLAAASPAGFEWWRARLTAGRRRGIGQVTAGDRPTRVGIVVGVLLLAGSRCSHGRLAASAGCIAVACACVAGAVQLRQLFGSVRRP
jgi:archaetidylinositol phosphate synthase